ncbi:Metallo-dependent phosphatase-like protein [Ampelomyces quisqualis]|uniref:Endopolyphosphatase n=1 Tax=Ampelomyces quisqualis TaxID=50730 RepID=A0A6A5QHP0_AMPQU|nr:Metallo-dependent phosphatase-like protein [Ampelomyces quisqualis]
MLRRDALICGLLLWGGSTTSSSAAGGRRLTGRFLHITDFHPDPFYKTYSSTTAEAACHRQRGPAGIYGAETSGCDSPYTLVNQTFQWINDHIKHDIDFVVWTGDSARHDNDDALPRTPKQVVQQNEYMVSKFAEVFAQHGSKHGGTGAWSIPVVPTFGNNDIMPHNIFRSGPNRWTRKYLDVWRSFIPEAQRHQFLQGGWFSVEVIPGKLAVISLNTIYFFSSNSAVDGCASKREPGYEHMEWLRIQLQILRERGMKAILMGHVPPARVDSKESWDETCWQKYTLWQRQFRDVIVGGLYGHMNIDHFMLQDFDQISKDAENGRMASGSSLKNLEDEGRLELYEHGEVTVASASDYLLDLRDAWAQLPAPPAKSTKKSRSSEVKSEDGYLDMIGGKYAERYSVTHVAPSVVPNYFPTLRIIEYNITGLENTRLPSGYSQSREPTSSSDQQPFTDNGDSDDDYGYIRDVEMASRRKKTNKKGPRKHKFRVPEGPSKSAPPGPAYSPQTFTWTRYTQYFANLTYINNDFVENNDTLSLDPRSPSTIFGLNVTKDGKIDHSRWKEGKHGKHQGKQPRPEPHPRDFIFEVEYDTKKDREFTDLTVRRWVEYARRIGHNAAKSNADADQVSEETKLNDGSKRDDAGRLMETEEEEDEDELEEQGKGKGGNKHKKKKGKKSRHHKASKEWYTFVKRAFVGTMNPHDIKQLFSVETVVETHEEVHEVLEL